MNYRFLKPALEEYEDAIEYYEQARQGLGDTFIREVEEALAVTLELPDMGSPVPNSPRAMNVRRRLIQPFSVALVYIVINDELVVVALFHTRRRPGYWRKRLGGLG